MAAIVINTLPKIDQSPLNKGLGPIIHPKTVGLGVLALPPLKEAVIEDSKALAPRVAVVSAAGGCAVASTAKKVGSTFASRHLAALQFAKKMEEQESASKSPYLSYAGVKPKKTEPKASCFRTVQVGGREVKVTVPEGPNLSFQRERSALKTLVPQEAPKMAPPVAEAKPTLKIEVVRSLSPKEELEEALLNAGNSPKEEDRDLVSIFKLTQGLYENSLYYIKKHQLQLDHRPKDKHLQKQLEVSKRDSKKLHAELFGYYEELIHKGYIPSLSSHDDDAFVITPSTGKVSPDIKSLEEVD
jgi:hypothetical protein